MTAYISLIKSTLKYMTVIWDPYLQKDIDKLEKVQCQAARFISGDYTSRVFPDAQNPAFWRIFNQNDPQKTNQYVIDDSIPKENKKSLVSFQSQHVYCIKFPTLVYPGISFGKKDHLTARGHNCWGDRYC